MAHVRMSTVRVSPGAGKLQRILLPLRDQVNGQGLTNSVVSSCRADRPSAARRARRRRQTACRLGQWDWLSAVQYSWNSWTSRTRGWLRRSSGATRRSPTARISVSTPGPRRMYTVLFATGGDTACVDVENEPWILLDTVDPGEVLRQEGPDTFDLDGPTISIVL